MLQSIIDKVFSGRFLATVAIVITYCSIVNMAAVSYVNALKNDPTKLEAFVVGLIMGFSGTATLVIKAYFDRNDREKTGGSDGKNITGVNKDVL